MLLTRVPVREAPDYYISVVGNGPDEVSRSFYTVVWVLFLSDSPLGLKPTRTVKNFHDSLVEDYDIVAVRFAELYDVVTTLFEYKDGVFTPCLAFDEYWQKFVNTPIAAEAYRFYRTADSDVMRYLLSFLSFGKRVEVHDTTHLVTTALRAWHDVDSRIGAIDFAPMTWLRDLRLIIKELLVPHFSHVTLPKNGSGSVAEGGVKTTHEKMSNVRLTRAQRYLFIRDGVEGHTLSDQDILSDPECDQDAELIDVPKSLTSVRLICKEPAKCQYLQQSVRLALEKSISEGPLGRIVNLHDQTISGAAALAASLHAMMDTLDLKWASDSVSMELVRKIFPPGILKYLIATRSVGVHIKPEGVTVYPSKYAPMGSACCFPIQCIIYAALCLRRYILLRHRSVTVSSLKRTLRAINDDPEILAFGLCSLKVYGDDIILDSRVTDGVIEDLTSLGFTVNVGKSFRGKQCFRESCGMYAFGGDDVTPFSLKLKGLRSYLTPEAYSGLLDSHNRAAKVGYYHISFLFLHAAMLWPHKKKDSMWVRLPSYGSGGIENLTIYSIVRSQLTAVTKTRSFDPTRAGRHRRTCDYLQREEVRTVYLVNIAESEKDDTRDNGYYYTLWMRSKYHVNSDEIAMRFAPKNGVKQRFVSRWSPDPLVSKETLTLSNECVVDWLGTTA